MKRSFSKIILALFLLQLPLTAQKLNENLKILEPMLEKNWQGDLKSPDGLQSWKTYREYKSLWDGAAVKFVTSTPERNSSSEGFFYWDRQEQKIAVIIINDKGIYQKGFAEIEEGLITIRGTISFPEKTFEFKNTFEFTSDGKMTDRWFQNAFGPWMAGHVIEFSAE